MTDEVNEEPKKSKKFWSNFKRFVQTYIPITDWLPKYKWKEYFVGDLMAGLTLGCLHVPQAMAFAILAEASPVMGLYTSCFSVLVYSFLGTAVVSSYGPVSITCLLIGNSISNFQSHHHDFTNDQLVTVITFIVGLCYAAAYILRFSVIVRLFTIPLTSGFVTACASEVVMESLQVVLGYRIERFSGYCNFIFNVYETFKRITDTNFITLGLSLSVLTVFAVNLFVLKPLLAKQTKIIIPIEMIVIIIVTTISYCLQLSDKGVSIVGHVPSGFPKPVSLEYKAISQIWVEAALIAVVNFATSMTMTVMFNPDMRAGQELLALAAANLITFSFETIPMGNSMMRSMIAQISGINTLLCDIVSSILVLFVVLFMGPLFQPLPQCVLGCIIIFGLSLLIVGELIKLPKLIKTGLENSIIWFVTFFMTLFVSVKIGLFVGLALTLRQFLASKDEHINDSKEPIETSPTPQPAAPHS